MIFGVGTDIVQVLRFESWQNYSSAQLSRVFSEKELAQCSIKEGEYDLEYLASRFAAKEAFFKALSATLVKLGFIKQTFSFLFVCQHVEVVKGTWDIPKLKVEWEDFEEKVGRKFPKLNVDLSISHEKRYAVCFVIISLS